MAVPQNPLKILNVFGSQLIRRLKSQATLPLGGLFSLSRSFFGSLAFLELPEHPFLRFAMLSIDFCDPGIKSSFTISSLDYQTQSVITQLAFNTDFTLIDIRKDFLFMWHFVSFVP
jgi:hypothetical protein